MDKIEKNVTINAPVQKVWEALVESKKLEEWMIMSTTFEPIVGRESHLKPKVRRIGMVTFIVKSKSWKLIRKLFTPGILK